MALPVMTEFGGRVLESKAWGVSYLRMTDRENVTPCTESLLSVNNIEICLTTA